MTPTLDSVYADCRDRALVWLTAGGHIQPGQDFSHVPPEVSEKMLRLESYTKRLIRDFKAPQEIEAEQEARRRAKVEARRLARRNEFESLVPREFWKLTIDGAPRPDQFTAVSTFLLDGGAYYSLEFQSTRKCGLYLAGKSGTGKTAAAWAMISRAIEDTEWDYEFVKSTRFFRLAKAKHLGKSENAEFAELFQSMLRTELLVIDDIGSERPSEGTLETVFELIDTRTENGDITIFTSNLSVAELARQFGRNAEKITRRLRQFFLVLNFN